MDPLGKFHQLKLLRHINNIEQTMMKLIFIAALLLSFLLCKAQQNPCPQPTDSLFLPLHKEEAKKMVDDLGYFLILISDKSIDPIDANDAINNAVKLFINEDAKVQISSIRNPNYKSNFTIREYLKRLKAIKYDRVEIEWTSIQYVSNLRLGDDGYYHGVISFEQSFKGIKDGRIIVGDLVGKNVIVILKPQQIEIDGMTFNCWRVFLSDITVNEIKG